MPENHIWWVDIGAFFSETDEKKAGYKKMPESRNKKEKIIRQA